MILSDDEDVDLRVVNLFEFYRAHGVSEMSAFQLVLHIVLTRSYGAELDAREVAAEFNVDIPYVLPDTGQLH